MDRDDTGFEAWLTQLEARTFETQEEAAAAMVELSITTNKKIANELEEAGAGEPRWEKLREYIRRAVEFIKRIAKEFGAIGYSIGVSLEGLFASVEWRGEIPIPPGDAS